VFYGFPEVTTVDSDWEMDRNGGDAQKSRELIDEGAIFPIAKKFLKEQRSRKA